MALHGTINVNENQIVKNFSIPHTYEDGAESLLIEILQTFETSLEQSGTSLDIPALR